MIKESLSQRESQESYEQEYGSESYAPEYVSKIELNMAIRCYQFSTENSAINLDTCQTEFNHELIFSCWNMRFTSCPKPVAITCKAKRSGACH